DTSTGGRLKVYEAGRVGRQYLGQNELRVDLRDVDSSPVEVDDVRKTLPIEVEEPLRLVASLPPRAQSEAIGADAAEEDRAEVEAQVLVYDLGRIVEGEPRRGHQRGHMLDAENV